MNKVKILIRSLKNQGLKKTAYKISELILNKLKNAPVHLAYLRLKLFKKILKRDKKRVTKILNYQVHHHDMKSLYVEFKDIFKNKIYHFETNNQEPIIIDGGGFIGLSVLYFKYVYPEAKIITFEPSKVALYFLNKNIIQNKLQDVTVIEKGLGAYDGLTSFEQSATDAGKISSTGDEKIAITKLSGYLTKKINFLKLNIEGAELDVLKDLEQSDKFKFIDQLCLEWHSFSYQKQNLDQILKILKDNGFKYLINHFDYESNQAARPPFKIKPKTQYYLIIYAKKV